MNYTMSKSELINKIAELYPKMHKINVVNSVNQLFEYISQAVAEERRMEIRGFGVLTSSTRIGTVRNPSNGTSYDGGERRVVRFKPSPTLIARLNK